TLLALEHLGDVAIGVEDGLVGADDAAGAAVDAQRRLDVVRLLRIAADRLGGTPLLASGASRAVLGDDREGHGRTLADARAAHQAGSPSVLRGPHGWSSPLSAASPSGSRPRVPARSDDHCAAPV